MGRHDRGCSDFSSRQRIDAAVLGRVLLLNSVHAVANESVRAKNLRYISVQEVYRRAVVFTRRGTLLANCGQ